MCFNSLFPVIKKTKKLCKSRVRKFSSSAIIFCDVNISAKLTRIANIYNRINLLINLFYLIYILQQQKKG